MRKRRRPARDALIRDAGPFVVVSQARGTLRVTPHYTGTGVRPECRTTKQNYCLRCRCYHVYGVFDRMELAARIARVLNSYVTKEAADG